MIFLFLTVPMEHPVSVWNKKYLSFSNFTMKDCMIRLYVVAFVPVLCLHIYLCFVWPGKDNIIKYLFLMCIWEILKPEKNYSFCLNFPILPEGSITIKIFHIFNIIHIYSQRELKDSDTVWVGLVTYVLKWSIFVIYWK